MTDEQFKIVAEMTVKTSEAFVALAKLFGSLTEHVVSELPNGLPATRLLSRIEQMQALLGEHAKLVATARKLLDLPED